MDFADINRDGYDDFLLLDMFSRDHVQRVAQMGDSINSILRIGEIANRPQYMRNYSLPNRGDGTYAEIGYLAGLTASEWSWGAAFVDVDLDGWEDLLIVNGHERSSRQLDYLERWQIARAEKNVCYRDSPGAQDLSRLDTANLAFRNRGNLTFEETGQSGALTIVGFHKGSPWRIWTTTAIRMFVNNSNGPLLFIGIMPPRRGSLFGSRGAHPTRRESGPVSKSLAGRCPCKARKSSAAAGICHPTILCGSLRREMLPTSSGSKLTGAAAAKRGQRGQGKPYLRN